MTIDAPGPTEAIPTQQPQHPQPIKRTESALPARPAQPTGELSDGPALRTAWRTVLIRRVAPVVGWIVTLALAAQLAQGAYGQLTESDRSVGMFEAIGYPASVVLLVGVLQGVAVVLYVVPWTAFLGALLLTAYLGGAVSAHIRMEDSVSHVLTPVLFAVGVWAALFLRSERVRWAVLTGR